MKILANENFPKTSIAKLRADGFDIEAVAEIMQGSPDTNVLKEAARKKQIIFTFDKDYGELVFHRKIAVPDGLIYFKFDPLTPEEPYELFMDVIAKNKIEITGWFIVLERDTLRKRRLP